MPKLKRTLGFVGLTFYGVGLIIGAGIYSVIGAAADEAQKGLWISFLVGAGVAFLTGLSYAELATTFPKAGAEYVFIRNALPQQKWTSFAVGFVLVMAGSATAAAVSLAFAGYLRLFIESPAWLLALLLLISATALNIIGIQQASWVNMVFTTIEVIGLLLVIGAGLLTPGFGKAIQAPLHVGVLSGAAIIFFVYLGFEDIANLSEEAKRPSPDVPRSILVSLAVTTTLYVLVGLAVVTLVTPDELATSDSPLATAAGAASSTLTDWLGGIALFATANTVMTTLIVTSRMLYSMAQRGDLPARVGQVLPKQQTPWIAALVMLGVSAAFLPFGRVAVVASLSSFASLLAFTSVNIALIILRYRDPQRERPFRVPLSIGRFPVLPALGALTALALASQFEAQVYLVGVVVVGIGVGLYAARRLWAKPEGTPPQ